MSDNGFVYLVGAGPGDPGLITVRGAECLGRADVVLYDSLASPDLLRLAHPSAELIDVGKIAGKHSVPQSETNAHILAHALAGKTVVRLKGGDPLLFGRGSQEALLLAENHIPFEIVPGVTAAVGAATYAGISLTDRDRASAVLLVTGHESAVKDEPSLDWDLVARGAWTVVIYMGLYKLAEIATRFVAGGKPPDTPAAVIASGTLPSQRTVVGTLSDIAARVRDAKLTRPALLVVGPVVELREKLAWFESRPLFGKTLLLLRPRHQAYEFAQRLRELGARVLAIPAIRIEPPLDRSALDATVDTLGSYDWVVFTSANGVDSLFDAVRAKRLDARAFGKARVAVIGRATAVALRARGIEPDFVPTRSTTAVLGTELAALCGPGAGKVLLVRADEVDHGMDEALVSVGARVHRLSAYRVVPAVENASQLAEALAHDAIDAIVFTSPSTVRSLAALLDEPDLGRLAREHAFLSIGPRTTSALLAAGAAVAMEALLHDMAGMEAAVLRLFETRVEAGNPRRAPTED